MYLDLSLFTAAAVCIRLWYGVYSSTAEKMSRTARFDDDVMFICYGLLRPTFASGDVDFQFNAAEIIFPVPSLPQTDISYIPVPPENNERTIIKQKQDRPSSIRRRAPTRTSAPVSHKASRRSYTLQQPSSYSHTTQRNGKNYQLYSTTRKNNVDERRHARVASRGRPQHPSAPTIGVPREAAAGAAARLLDASCLQARQDHHSPEG